MTSATASKPYAEVIGDPIAHSKSPAIHNFWLERQGIDAEYRTCRVSPQELESYFEARRSDSLWRGCNVTIPHKQAVQPFLDMLDEKANAVGAVNTVFRGVDGGLSGTNTDVDGVREAIATVSASSAIAVVIGAGGAARAAFAQLAGMGFAQTRVLARTPAKARTAIDECGLEAQIYPLADSSDCFEGASLLINATQLGMSGQEPMPDLVLDGIAAMHVEALIFDMVYAPLETELLKAARARNLHTTDGLTMLIGQAATAFARFFGEKPARIDDGDLKRKLVA